MRSLGILKVNLYRRTPRLVISPSPVPDFFFTPVGPHSLSHNPRGILWDTVRPWFTAVCREPEICSEYRTVRDNLGSGFYKLAYGDPVSYSGKLRSPVEYRGIPLFSTLASLQEPGTNTTIFLI